MAWGLSRPFIIERTHGVRAMLINRFAVVLVGCGLAARVGAQTLPSEPVTLASGRVVVSADAAASMAPVDRGYFNYSDYDHSTLRELRLGVTTSVRATDRISVLGEVRADNLNRLSAFALYARIRPFTNRRFDLQIGRIPPTFGAFTRRAYGNDNPLIGYPLAYQYLTSLRPDAIPASADELLRMRARGWRSKFTVGNPAEDRGVPLVTAFNWDTGVQANVSWQAVTMTAAVTNGSASNPRVLDDNDGKQIAARVSVRPATGMVLGSSFARGEFLSRSVLDSITPENHDTFTQRAYGADAEYSRDHWLVRGDLVVSQWELPVPVSGPSLMLRAVATSVEGRYTFMPGFYGAARVEHLGFNRITATAGRLPWEAAVSRVEVGGGYYLQRNLVARVSVQRNERQAGRVRQNRLLAAQLLYWF